MAKEEGEEGETGRGRGAVGHMGGRDQRKVEEDYGLLLRDLEEDPDMRFTVNLYKADGTKPGKDRSRITSDAKPPNRTQNAMEVDETPTPVTELVSEADEQDEAEAADFPGVKLDELLEKFDEMTLGERSCLEFL